MSLMIQKVFSDLVKTFDDQLYFILSVHCETLSVNLNMKSTFGVSWFKFKFSCMNPKGLVGIKRFHFPHVYRDVYRFYTVNSLRT